MHGKRNCRKSANKKIPGYRRNLTISVLHKSNAINSTKIANTKYQWNLSRDLRNRRNRQRSRENACCRLQSENRKNFSSYNLMEKHFCGCNFGKMVKLQMENMQAFSWNLHRGLCDPGLGSYAGHIGSGTGPVDNPPMGSHWHITFIAIRLAGIWNGYPWVYQQWKFILSLFWPSLWS